MKRIQSTYDINNGNGLDNKNVLEHINKIFKEIHLLKREIKELKENEEWTQKYSKRMVVVSNTLLSIYVFLSRLLELFHSPLLKKMILPWKQIEMRDIYQYFWKDILKSILFLYSSHWLNSKDVTKKYFSILVSLISSLTLDSSPIIYFHLFSLALFTWSSNKLTVY